MKKGCLLFLLSLGLLVSCSSVEKDPAGQGKEPETPSVTEEGYVLKSTTKYFDGNNAGYAHVIDASTVHILSNAPAALVPAAGDVVLVGVSEQAPDGFMGKAVSIEKTAEYSVVKTEPASLEEIFEELHVDTTLEVFQECTSLVDEDGNEYACNAVDDKIWDALSGEEEEDVDIGDYVKSKASIGGEKSFTKSLPIKTSTFFGDLIMRSELSVKIDLQRGKIQDYDIVVNNKSYLEGSLGVSGGGKAITLVPQVTLRLPVSIPVGGIIILRPAIVSSITLVPQGSIKIAGKVRFGISDTIVRYHNGTHTETRGDMPPVSVSSEYLDCEGSLTLKPRVALQFGVWGQSILAFGVDATPDLVVELSGKVYMSDKSLLDKKLTARATFAPSFGIYLYSKLFSSVFNNIRASVSIPSVSYDLDVLNWPTDRKLIRSEPGEFKVSAGFNGKTLMEVDEAGFALFLPEEEEPVKKVPAKKSASSVKALSSSESSVEIEYTGDPLKYIVRPYNKVKDYYFYGEAFLEAVDMGLSVPWGSKNVGADTGYDEGVFQPWSSSDIATAYYGEDWRLPTRAEIEELIDGCTWSTHGNGFNAVSKTNGNTLFFPKGGVINGTEGFKYNEDFGEYWSSESDSDTEPHAYRLQISEEMVYCSSKYGVDKRQFRPVYIQK